MSDIYRQHVVTFATVNAYVILSAGQPVATVAVKHGTAVTAYVHVKGLEMVRARAGGGGYDRESAAVADAIGKVTAKPCNNPEDWAVAHTLTQLRETVRDMDARHWQQVLQAAGFRVVQAV